MSQENINQLKIRVLKLFDELLDTYIKIPGRSECEVTSQGVTLKFIKVKQWKFLVRIHASTGDCELGNLPPKYMLETASLAQRIPEEFKKNSEKLLDELQDTESFLNLLIFNNKKDQNGHPND